MASGGLLKTADWITKRTSESHIAKAKKKNGCATLAELMYRLGCESNEFRPSATAPDPAGGATGTKQKEKK